MTARVRTLDEARASRTSLPDPGPDPWDQSDPLDVGYVPDWMRVDTTPEPPAVTDVSLFDLAGQSAGGSRG